MKTSQNIAELLVTAYLFLVRVAQPIRTVVARQASARRLPIPQIAKGLGRIASMFLLGMTCLVCASSVCAQAPPDGAQATWAGGHAINVIFTACYASDEANCACSVTDPTNCYPNNDFSIYRNPPDFTKLLVAGPQDATVYQHTYTDTSVVPGQTYTYMVCGGGYANSGKSNCINTNAVAVPNSPPPTAPQPSVKLFYNSTSIGPSGGAVLGWSSTNATSLDLEPGVGKVAVPTGSSSILSPKQTTTYTITATGPGGTATANAVVCGPMFPTQNLSLYVTALKWTNPNQTCQSNPSDIPVYRWTPSSNWSQRADLPAVNGVLPNRFVDQDDLLPHSTYVYQVCQGAPDGSGVNCAFSNVMTAWGADPVLTAVPVSNTSVKLEVAVDDAADIQTIRVTRGVINTTCGQGKQLGNGLQGCATVTVGPNGVATPVTAGPMTPIYNWTWLGTTPSKSNSAPYIIDIPNDNSVKPGVEYFYQAEVDWGHPLAFGASAPRTPQGDSQDSDNVVVTVPTQLGALVSQQTLVGGPIKLNAGAPPPQSQSKIATAPIASSTRSITPVSTSPMMRSPGPAVAPPPQSLTAARPMTAQMTAPTTTMLQPSQPMMSAAPPVVHAATTARLTVPLMTAPSSRMTPAAGSASLSPVAANLAAAIKQVQQKPRDAQALYALGKAYCASRLKDTGVSYMYMALILADQSRNASLASQIKTSLAGEGVRAEGLDRGSK